MLLYNHRRGEKKGKVRTMKKYVGRKVEEVLEELKAKSVEFDYEEETEDTTGGIYIGGYWSDHYELEIEDGVVAYEGQHYWD